MKLFRSNKIKIKKDDLNDAKMSSATFKNIDVQKRAFLDVLGARIALNDFFSQRINISNLYSLYTINSIRERLDISDIYFNDLKIDVRIVFNDNEIFIPKSHFIYDIEPDIYLIIKLDNFDNALILGYITPDDIDRTKENNTFYFVDKSKLKSMDNPKKLFKNFQKKQRPEKEILSKDRVEMLFIKLTDKHISDSEFEKLIYSLNRDIQLRERLSEFENFEFIANNTSNNKVLKEDSMLGIVGAQDNYKDATEEETLGEALFDEDATMSSNEYIENLLNAASKTIEETEKTVDFLENSGEKIAEELLSDVADNVLETENKEVSEQDITEPVEDDILTEEEPENIETSDDIVPEPVEDDILAEEEPENVETSDDIESEPVEDDILAEEEPENIETSDDIVPEPVEDDILAEEEPENVETSDDIVPEPVEDDILTEEEPENIETSDDVVPEPVEDDILEEEEPENVETSDDIVPEPVEDDILAEEEPENVETSDDIVPEPVEDDILAEEEPEIFEDKPDILLNDEDTDAFISMDNDSDSLTDNLEQTPYNPDSSISDDFLLNHDDEVISLDNSSDNLSIDLTSDISDSSDNFLLNDDENTIDLDTKQDMPSENFLPDEESSEDSDGFEVGNIDDLFDEPDSDSTEEPVISEPVTEEWKEPVISEQDLSEPTLEEWKEPVISEQDLSEPILEEWKEPVINQEQDNEEFFILPELKPLDEEEEPEIPERKQEVYEYAFEMDTASTDDEDEKTEDNEEDKKPDTKETIKEEESLLPKTEEFITKEEILEEKAEKEQQEEPVDKKDTEAFLPTSEETTETTETSFDEMTFGDISELDDFMNSEPVNTEADTTAQTEALAEKIVNGSKDENSENKKQEVIVPQINLSADLDAVANIIDLDKEIENSVTDNKHKKNPLSVLFNRNKNNDEQDTSNNNNITDIQPITPKNLVILITSICILFTTLIILGSFVGIKLYDGVKAKTEEKQASALKEEEPDYEIVNSQVPESTEPISPHVKDVSWEVPEALAYNDVIREYLQLAGKNLKLNLENEFILSTEYVYTDSVVADIYMTKQGSVDFVKIVHSSGSPAIDKMIVNTIKETLRYIKMPTEELTDNEIDLSLVIKF